MIDRLKIARQEQIQSITSHSWTKDSIISFETTEANERDTALALRSVREIDEPDDSYDMSKLRIYYISDIHLVHKLSHLKSISDKAIEQMIREIVNNIVEGVGGMLLIGGDVSSDFSLFTLFVKLLREALDLNNKRYTCIVFVLGNHELWEFPQYSFDEIVAKYESVLHKYGMHLLQNSILYKDNEYRIQTIPRDVLCSLNSLELHDRLKSSRFIMFGGLAFSGYNAIFNADNGIYRDTISRDQEKKESEKFENLYNTVLDAIPDRNAVVFTHTPMDCWKKDPKYHKEYIYVNGHTHKNHFYDDGEIHVYSDNQIGYGNNPVHLKWFYTDCEYDIFSNYPDGIYQICADEYREFYRGKNIRMTFNRKVHTLRMLKKRGYYCFIHESERGALSILNGGNMKRLYCFKINYYYDNMDSVIDRIKSPLEKYTSIQEKIANEIRKIGGSGTIHGCIIDIDYNNHIYVNPIDLKTTAYWAADIINKVIYPSVPALLEKECPSMYLTYRRLLTEKAGNLPVLANESTLDIIDQPQSYLDTDIYKASREIKKMQRLRSNILTTWYEENKKALTVV